MHSRSRTRSGGRNGAAALVAGLLSLALFARVAQAVDGVIEISQTRALAGGISSGDAPGFPILLSEPGAYRLTSNLEPTSIDVDAIQIDSNDVSLDLNGFSIIGQADCSGSPGVMTCPVSGSGDGIRTPGDTLVSNVTVRNGTLLKLRIGVFLAGGSIRVDRLTIRRCSGSAIVLNTAGAEVTRSSVTLNRGEGIDTSIDSRVIGNTASANDGTGVNVGQFSLVRGNIVTANGDKGIAAPRGSLIIGNTVADNLGLGLLLVDGPGYLNNVLDGNLEPQVTGGIQMGTNICGPQSCP